MTLASLPAWRRRSRSRLDEARFLEAEAALWDFHGMTPEQHWIEVEPLGIRVRALVHGEGRPVVYVHGNPTAGNVFVPLVAHMEGVRSIVVDRPGCALSEPLDYAAMTPQDLRDAVTSYLGAVIDGLAGGRADLIGNSAGGMAALAATVQRPERVRSLVLEGVPAIQGMQLPRELRLSSLSPVARLVARHRLTAQDLRRSFRAMGHAAIVDAGGPSGPELAWRIALSRHTDTYRHELELLRLAASWRGLRRAWVVGRADLESLAVPSLWIAGALDPFASPARVEAWAAHAPRSAVRIMENSGHQPWLDGPATHAELISRWWAEVAPPP